MLEVRTFVERPAVDPLDSGVERAALSVAVRELLAERSPVAGLAPDVDHEAEFDRALWARLGSELGVLGLAVATELGGEGFGWAAQATVLGEMGRALYSGPYLATVTQALPLLTALPGSSEARSLVAAALSGQKIVTAWLPDAFGRRPLPVAAAGGRLRGALPAVLCGAQADVVVVPAVDGDGVALFAVDAAAAEVSVLGALDLRRSFARIDLDGVPGSRLCAGDEGSATLASAMHHAVIGLGAEQAGAARGALDLAVQYARERRQFDRPIGSFQLVKAACTQMLLDVSTADAFVEHAAWCLDAGAGHVAAAAAACGAVCSETFAQAAYQALHVHGGLGFTWEHPAHLYYRRARSDALLLGSPANHRAALADHVCGADPDPAIRPLGNPMPDRAFH